MVDAPPAAPEAPAGLVLVAPEGMGEVTPGSDLPRSIALLATGVTWPDGSRGLSPGDVAVVTSKIVSKAQGRTRPAVGLDAALRDETAEVLAELPSGSVVVRNHLGVVLAAAGIDATNSPAGEVILWPEDRTALLATFAQGSSGPPV